ncbi:hypothetical protein ACWGLF_17885 [Streptomyces puniciscabiei]
MTPASATRSPLRRIMALFVAVTSTLSLSVMLTVTSATHASALCAATGFEGTWISTDDRLSRIDVWLGGGEGCHLFAKAWHTCPNDPTSDCPLSKNNKELHETPQRNFKFFYYNFSDRNQVLQLRLQTNRTDMSVWDHVDFHDGRQDSFTVLMTKDVNA